MDGSPELTPDEGKLRVRILLLLFVLFSCFQTALAAEIRAIRFGQYEGNPRLVVELSSAATYRIANNSSGKKSISVEIAGITKTVDGITGSAPGFEGWRLVRNSAGKKVNLEFTVGKAFQVTDFTLASPSRIVLDFAPAGTTASAAPKATPAPAARPSAPTAAPVSASGRWVRRIIVDPGHGGYHKGGVGRIGNRQVTEKELTILVAERLEKLLKKDPRFEVRLTRREDVYMGLLERTLKATELEGDLFISIHANAVEGKAAQARARGFEIWIWNRKSNSSAAARAIERLENDDPAMSASNNRLLTSMMEDALESQALVSRRVAQAVHARAIKHPYLRKNDRGIQAARFKVLEVYDMPSILVELGFMTHPEEVKLMFTEQFQQDWAVIMYEGIVRYYEESDPTFPRLSAAQIAAAKR